MGAHFSPSKKSEFPTAQPRESDAPTKLCDVVRLDDLVA